MLTLKYRALPTVHVNVAFSPARAAVGPRGEAAAPQSVFTAHRGTIADSGSSLRQGDVSGDAVGTPLFQAESPSSQFHTPVTQIFLLVRRGCRDPKSF